MPRAASPQGFASGRTASHNHVPAVLLDIDQPRIVTEIGERVRGMIASRQGVAVGRSYSCFQSVMERQVEATNFKRSSLTVTSLFEMPQKHPGSKSSRVENPHVTASAPAFRCRSRGFRCGAEEQYLSGVAVHLYNHLQVHSPSTHCRADTDLRCRVSNILSCLACVDWYSISY